MARFIDCCCSRPVDDKKIRPTVIRSLELVQNLVFTTTTIVMQMLGKL